MWMTRVTCMSVFSYHRTDISVAIGMMIDKSLLYLVTSKLTVVETWHAMREHFERTNATNVYFLLAQLFELDLEEGAAVDVHLKQFTELCERLLAVELEAPRRFDLGSSF